MWRGGDWQAGSCLGLNRALLLPGSHSRGHTQAACEDSSSGSRLGLGQRQTHT